MMRSFFIILMVAFIWSGLFGQSDISMSTDWYNRGNYNPAFIARPGYIYLFANNRYQWTKVAGAPDVLNIQASEYIHSLRSAFGLSLVYDKIGLATVMNPMFHYAYRISHPKGWALSLGVSAGATSVNIDGSRFDPFDENDPALFKDVERSFRPDANVGGEFQSPHFIAGFSTTHLFALFNKENSYLNSNHRYAYFIYKNTDPEFINYSIGTKFVNRYSLSVLDVNLMVRFKHPTDGLIKLPKEIFEMGVAYRTSQQLVFLLGINISHSFKVGYAYDKFLRPGYSNNHTHELTLEYRIPSKRSSTASDCRCEELWYY